MILGGQLPGKVGRRWGKEIHRTKVRCIFLPQLATTWQISLVQSTNITHAKREYHILPQVKYFTVILATLKLKRSS